MILLKHKLTGVSGFYPEHFADFDYFEVVTEEPCTDCLGNAEDDHEIEEEPEDE